MRYTVYRVAVGLASALGSTACAAQSGSIIWQASPGGSGNEERCFDVINVPDDGYLLAGTSNSYDGDAIGQHGGGDGWLVRLDMFGGLIWSQCYGGTGNDGFMQCKPTLDGGFIAVGHSLYAGGDITSSYGYGDMWALKCDAGGTVQWSKSFGGSDVDMAYDVVQCADSGFIIGGLSRSTDGHAADHHGTSSYSDVLLVRVDATGNLIWARSYGGTGNEGALDIYAKRLALATHDGVQVNAVAYTDSEDGDVNYSPVHTLDVWHLALDTTGTLLWNRCYGGTNFDIPYGMTTTADGGHAFVAGTRSGNYDVGDYYGDYDTWVVKLDSVGNIEWESTVGTAGYQDPASIVTLPDHSFLVCGRSSSAVPGFPNQGMMDLHVAHLTPSGQIDWQGLYGGSAADEGGGAGARWWAIGRRPYGIE